MQFLLRKSYTSTMLLVFYAIFHHKGQSIFSKLQPCFPSLGALLMLNYISLYALFFNKNLYKYNVINVLCYFYTKKFYSLNMFFTLLQGALLYPLAPKQGFCLKHSYAIFINKILYKYHVINVLCYFL